ncbi:MAG: hypothetical protein E7414_02435 [Ruminococcaceae bacterium]|nr:hypothetical protein [Oscillospiraceae bacterium]
MKKLITLLLSVLLIIGTLPVLTGYAAEDSGENLAVGKTITADSTMGGYTTNNLTDGNLKSIWAGSGAVTVDLGETYRITSVMLYPRTDIDQVGTRTNLILELSNTPDFAVKERMVAVDSTDPGFGVPAEVRITSKTPYRYVRVAQKSLGHSVFAEIEIYGYILDPNEIEIGVDVIGHKQEGPLSLLTYLGLVENVNDSIFGVDHLLTRAQAARAVVKALGSNASFSGYLPFTDVPATHKNYQDIMTAYHLGIVTGSDGETFRPNEYVSKTELLFMTLRAIGYDDVVQTLFGNGASHVLNLADKLDLLEGVEYETLNEPINRADAHRVFYNALLAPDFNMYAAHEGRLVFEEDADLLRRRHNLVLTQGVVEETRLTSLDGDTKQGKHAVRIGGKAFSDPNGRLDAYIGKNVIIATDQDAPDRILLAWLTGRDEEVVLPASRLISTEADINSGRIIALDDDGDDERYTLEDNFYVIKNGLVHPYHTTEDLMLKNGQMRLLDNNRNGIYDVVFLEEYTVHYVAGAFSNETELTIVNTEGERILLERDSLSVTNAEGNAQSVNKVAKDTVIKLFSTPDGKNCRIILYNKPVEGKLTAISDEEAAIDGTTYPLSCFYKDETWAFEPRPGEDVKAFVDEAGEILWMERGSEEWTIAFSQKTAIGTGLTPSVTFRMFTQDGTWKEHDVAEKVTLDGVSVTREDLADMIVAARGTERFELSMLRFKLNGAGQIKVFDTLVETAAEAADGISFNKDRYIGTALYTSATSSFWSYQDQIYFAKSDTPTFVLPKVNGTYTADSSYDSLYYVRTVAQAAGQNDFHSLGLQAYMLDEDGYPTCFVKTDINMSGGQTSAVISTNTAPNLLVEKVTTAVVDDTVVMKVSGYNVLNLTKTSFYVESTMEMIETGLLFQEKPNCLKNGQHRHQVNASALSALTDEEKAIYISNVTELGFGDLVRYEIVGGASTAQAVERVFDYDQTTMPTAGESPLCKAWYTIGGNYPDFSFAPYRYQFGTLSNVDQKKFTLTTPYSLDEIYPKTALSKIIYCDTEGTTPTLVEGSDLYEYDIASNRVMLFSNGGQPKLAIVYPYQ